PRHRLIARPCRLGRPKNIRGPVPRRPPMHGRSGECMEDLVLPLLAFIKAHESWAVAIVFITGFGESFAFLSLLFPGTTLLIAAGTLMSDRTLSYTPVLIGAVLGATLGDTVSYWIGRRFGSGIARIWPFSRNPE